MTEDGDADSGAGASDDASEKAGESGASAKWRCTWCGKPHEKNDPPCDNCGHHKFEKAVVPAAPSVDEEYQREPVWVCTACGRQHQKHSPPCSRCGNATLEKHIPDDEDFADELGGTSYLDVLEPRYVLGLAFAIVAGGVLILALLGFITLPGMGGDSLQVDNVPGDADTADGVALADVETAYLAELNERRSESGLSALSRDDGLDDVATFLNQRWVKGRYTDEPTPEADGISGPYREACGSQEPVPFTATRRTDADAFDSADSLSAVAVEAYFTQVTDPREFAVGRTGLDVHVGPDDRVFVTQISC